ncbi:MAG: hypothetical protein LC781_21875 [Actinobacteria bacterium]|nr:hypothetical protein [Actinomycetota bacterium]
MGGMPRIGRLLTDRAFRKVLRKTEAGFDAGDHETPTLILNTRIGQRA